MDKTLKYNICLAMAQKTISNAVFKEIAYLLKSSFDSLDIDCTQGINHMDKNRINIVLCYQLLKYEDTLKEYKYIPYQFEQLNPEEGWLSQKNPLSANMIKVLKNAFEVWDYSESNISILKCFLGINAKLLPMGYHERLERVKHKKVKDIDILFYGHASERRSYLMSEISKEHGIKSLFVKSAYGEDIDNYIARSKIVLNIHFLHNTHVFESARISYLLNNACFVISETSTDNPYDRIPLCLVPYDEILDQCKHYLKNRREAEELRKEIFRSYKETYSMIEMLKKVIK